jgi:hypothetical protein
MALLASQVLQDCRLAHAALEEEQDAAMFRVLWVAAIALVRAVGHVLSKVDAQGDPDLRARLDVIWPKWKAGEGPAIVFAGFVEPQRNRVLKEYDMGYDDGAVWLALGDSDGLATGFDLGEGNLFRPLSSGPFAGEDARDILTDAIAWWDSQLQTLSQPAADG